MKFFICLFCLLAFSPHADAKLYNELGEIIEGAGPKGRYTSEQLIPQVMRTMPGEILDTNSSWQNDDFYHEFLIKRPDGSIFELEYFAITGELYEIEIDYLSENPVLPFNIIDQETAEEIARQEIQENTKGRQKARTKESEIGTQSRKLIYSVGVRKGPREYEVIIEAFKGDVLDVKKE